jgi:hypothetical protein
MDTLHRKIPADTDSDPNARNFINIHQCTQHLTPGHYTCNTGVLFCFGQATRSKKEPPSKTAVRATICRLLALLIAKSYSLTCLQCHFRDTMLRQAVKAWSDYHLPPSMLHLYCTGLSIYIYNASMQHNTSTRLLTLVHLVEPC